MLTKVTILTLSILFLVLALPFSANAQTSWPMPGANPQRTNWVTENGPSGKLQFLWITPFEPQLPYTTTPIAADGKIFVPTSRGIYALNADTGSPVWVFATEMPITSAPTFDSGFLYFGGLDRKVYKISASTGAKTWEFEADSGFSTNPIVVNALV